MHLLFLFLAFLSPSDCESLSRTPSLRQSTSPAGAPTKSPITELTTELSSNDNGFLLSEKRDVGAFVQSSTPTPSSTRPSMFASSPSIRTDSFKLYFTLYISPASSKMDVATTNVFQNCTLTFMTENVPTFSGVAVDVNSIVVIGQLLVKQEESKMDKDQVLQIDAFVSGSIAMDFQITNLTRVAVQKSITLTLFSHGASLQSYLSAASIFFESIDQSTMSHQNDNGLVVAVSTEANEIGISKPAVLATAGTLTLFLIIILVGFISFRRYRKRALRKKKLSSNYAPDATGPIDENCRERPPVQHIASDDQASVTSSVSGISEILCGALRYSKGEVSGARAIKERYPVQERRMNESKQQYYTQEKRSDQASNVSVLSDLFFDNWSVFSAIRPVETTRDVPKCLAQNLGRYRISDE